MVTHVVAIAWKRLCEEKQAVICKSFRDVGIFLPIDRSEDYLLSIKGFPSNELEIGDYNQRDEEIDKYQEILIKVDDNNKEYELDCETSEYKGVSRAVLRNIMKDRGLKGISYTR